MDELGFGGDAMRVKRCERRRDWVVRFWRSEWGGGFDRGVVCAIVGEYSTQLWLQTYFCGRKQGRCQKRVAVTGSNLSDIRPGRGLQLFG